jgi:competence protein ComEC
LKFWALLIWGAVSPYLFNSTLGSDLALVLLLLTAFIGLRLKADLRVFCLAPVAFLVTTLAINDRISERFPVSQSGTVARLDGVIASLPKSSGDALRFVFVPDTDDPSVPKKILVYWYADRGEKTSGLPKLQAGERWQLELKLRAPRSRVNFHGMDAERWYFTQGIAATGQVQSGRGKRISGPGPFSLLHWRESVLDKIADEAGEVSTFRLLAALAIADRRDLSPHDRNVFSATGTGHLLAISGLHIGLAAMMGYYAGRIFLVLLPITLKLRFAITLPWLCSWCCALSYSALSGFGVSTQRALIMLTVACVVMVSRRNTHPVLAWLIAMALVLLADPFAPMRAGFWFSFAAVAVLMMLFLPACGRIPAWRRMLLAQFGISLIMAPLGMYWFQQASVPGFLANLVAIPLVSILIVPLILVALPLLALALPVASWLLGTAGILLQWLFLFLEFLSSFQPGLFAATRATGLAMTLLAMLGGAVLLLPRGVPGRYTGLLLMLPLMLPAKPAVSQGQTQIDFLDVGQGLAVLLTSHDYQLLYDTGPGNGLDGENRRDTVNGTIKPAITATGKQPDLVVASHADLDHAGGLASLRRVYPESAYMASLPVAYAGVSPCRTPLKWRQGSLTFEVLHPTPGLPYLGNDSSCVISVNGPGLSLLLSGDIGRVVEQRLVDWGLARHSILTVPHHGSSTSSSQAFITAVSPSLGLVSAALNNRFDFPKADVMVRYSRSRVQIFNTALCGGIRITSKAGGETQVEVARQARNAIWRWPADENCLNMSNDVTY